MFCQTKMRSACRLSSSLARRIFATNMRAVAFSHALLLCACVSSAAGFSAPHASATRPRAELLAVRRQAVTVSMIEEIPRPDAGRFPFRTVVLGLLSLQSAIGLTADNELGGLITRFTDATLVTNYFNTFFDSAFLAYGANTLLNQAGLIKENPKTSSVTLSDMTVQITLSVGREQGTWMPKEWAASGARLSLPMRVRFSDETVDMGFPGEEALNPGGARYGS